MPQERSSPVQARRLARTLRVGAWCRSLAFEQTLRAEAELLRDTVFSVLTRPASARATLESGAEDYDVLVIDVDLSNMEEFVFLSRIVEVRGARRPVIATASSAAVDDVRRLMRLGIADFLPQPITGAELGHALDSIAQRLTLDDISAKQGAVTLFMRAAGGAGATTLATHFAFALASGHAQGRIAVLDLDLQRGAAGIHLDVGVDVGVVNCLERFPHIEPGLIESVASKHSSGIDVFAATANRWPLDDYSPEAIVQLIDVMRRIYDWVVVDAPPAWTRWHHALLERTDVAVVVLQETVAHLRLARGFISALQQDLRSDQIVTVCNRARQSWFGRNLSRREVALALGRPADCAVPSDFAGVTEAVDLGVPISEVKRRSKFERAMIALTDEIKQRATRRGLGSSISGAEQTSSTEHRWPDETRRAAE